jgi:hypothetical protein
VEEILEWAIAGYMSNPEADDEEVAGLVAGGFPRGLASRAVVFLPLAFGRRLLRGLIKLPETFVADGHERPLASEPLFVRAERLAAEAGRESIQRIGLHSAEIRVVNQLNADVKLEDAVLAPPHVWFHGPTDGATSTASMLAAFLAGHGSSLACEARVFPYELRPTVAFAQIDIVVSAPALEGRQVVDSFGCYESTIAEAQKSVIHRFVEGSLHPLLATLEEERHGGDQVDWETWGDFRVCMGRLLLQWSDEVDADRIDFAAYLDELKARLLSANLSRQVHWYRTFVFVGKDGVTGHDALLDNDLWPPGVDAVTGWPWPRPRGEQPYALRHFLVLVPNAT